MRKLKHRGTINSFSIIELVNREQSLKPNGLQKLSGITSTLDNKMISNSKSLAKFEIMNGNRMHN